MTDNKLNPELIDLFNQEEELINHLPANFSQFKCRTSAEWENDFNYTKKFALISDPDHIVFCQAFNKRISKCF